MRVLFATHKYMNAYAGDMRLSAHRYGIIGSAEAIGIDADCYYFDEEKGDGYDSYDRPDLIVATPLVDHEHNIPPDGFHKDVPVVCVWFESAKVVVDAADLYAPHVTAN